MHRIDAPLLTPTVSVAPVIQPTWQALAIDIALIGAFALHHSFLARPSIKKIWWRWVSAPFRRATFSHVANLFAYAIVFLWQPIPIVLWQFDSSSLLRYLILVPFGIAWVMLLVGASSFNLAALFGLRQIWFWSEGKPNEPIDITTGRIYQLARHPEFLGVFVGVWFAADMTVGHLLLASSFTAYSLIALRIKDRELGKALGSAYTSYCARVPMLGPNWLTAAFLVAWLLLSVTAILQSLAQLRYDQQARNDLQQLRQALVTYKTRTGDNPPRHLIGACERPEQKPLYDELMGKLMSTGSIAKPLAHPARPAKGFGYCLWEMDAGGKAVLAVWTRLPSSPLSNTGEAGTCRSSEPSDFCSSIQASHDYCLCVP